MLSDLSKNDSQWRKMAFCICKNKSLADDLTNEMYLKVYESKKKIDEINQWFIYRVLKNLYLHHLRRVKKIKVFADFLDIQINDEGECEILKARKVINEALNEIWIVEIQESKLMFNNLLEKASYEKGVKKIKTLRKAVKSREQWIKLKKESSYYREILLNTSERSIRDNVEYLGLTRGVLQHAKKNGIKKLKETQTIKKYKSA